MTIEDEFSKFEQIDKKAREKMAPNLLKALQEYDRLYSFTLAAKGLDELPIDDIIAIKNAVHHASEAIDEYHRFFDQLKR